MGWPRRSLNSVCRIFPPPANSMITAPIACWSSERLQPSRERSACGRQVAALSLSAAIGIGFCAQGQADRGARQIEVSAQGIDKVAPIRVGDRISPAAEQYECGWARLRLGDVVELDTPTR